MNIVSKLNLSQCSVWYILFVSGEARRFEVKDSTLQNRTFNNANKFLI